jgi:hypothetical protein
MLHDEKLAERVRRLLADRSDVVEKRMFGGVAFMVRGHMCCGLVGARLMVRLDPALADDMLRREQHVAPMDFSGRPMRGFLFVDPPAVATAAGLRRWLGLATARAESQPARRTSVPKRRRVAGAKVR